MGNNSSSSSYANGGIYIQTDQPFYIAGDTVTGKVHISIQESFPANVLSLKIKGYESSYWEEKKKKSNKIGGKYHTQTYYKFHTGKNTFFSHQFPLYIWSNFSYMPAGQFTFPFQFKLMDTLPGSYYENGTYKGCEYKAAIKYKVKVEISSSNNKKLKNKQDLIIREPLKTQVASQYQEDVVKPKTWCCISQGQSQIKCHFERNSYMPGETAHMLVDIDNSQCNLQIKNLKCSLNKRLKLTSNSGKSRTIKKEICSRDFEGLAAHQTATQNNRRNCEINLIRNKDKVIQPSTTGKLVSCEYNLNISTNFNGCICCSDEPEVTVPITIISPPPSNYGQIQPPPNWNPQVFEVKTFAFSSDYMYSKNSPPPPGMSNNINMPPPPPMNPVPPLMYPPNDPMPPPIMNMNVNRNANQNTNMNVQLNQQVQYQDNNMQMGMGAPGMQIQVNNHQYQHNQNQQPPNMNMQFNGGAPPIL
ncbi:arrestin (macronuclear) [Tetrahymena thermophila SB210]|uniref:Arrestin n=1 Tax=Tetrahymena thermophila (strain SB210) TaxID=312017 RepID=I7M2Z2_TETTS|nr:arrestin [Tetrahymena thermophila SB210]EAS01748.1 arrestin [Tetrahymena thermophila SB210]|eukprot:XP_001021993.1 arrestin [Tetrahymena thermophila SB210]